MKYLVSIFLYWFAAFLTAAQEFDSKILMTIDGREVEAGEFIRMYHKSAAIGDKVNFDAYLEQFVTFKLKVANAIREGYDTTKAFKNELKSYRDQVAHNYLTDKDIKEKLLRRTYEKYTKEINVLHILVSCPPNSSPDDTIAAYKKALEIKARIISGEPFDQVARSTSDDPSVHVNGGNLGYLTVFQMITPFENAMYSLKEGEISDPVKTPYGYHIIKVADIRPSRGKIKVAHIMRSIPGNARPEMEKAAEDTIWSVYRQLQAGASFSELAKKYSNHHESAAKGGELSWFGTGEIIPEFTEVAFALKANGDFSTPFKTPYGWHIIKRIDRKDPLPYEQAKAELETKLNEAWINAEGLKSFTEKLQKEYNFKLDNATLNWFLQNTDTLIIKGYSKYDRKRLPSGILFSFADKSCKAIEFASFIENKASSQVHDLPEKFVKNRLETFITDHLINYENSILEKKYPEFRYLVKEFHDGILLFEISSKKVWDRVQNDTTGLMDFYEKNKYKFPGKRSVEANIYICSNPDSEKSFYSVFRNKKNISAIEKKLMRYFTTKTDTLFTVHKGIFEEGDSLLPMDMHWEKSIIKSRINGLPSIVYILRVIEPRPLPLSSIIGEVSEQYQQYLEEEWVKQLKKDYPVKINNEVLEDVKKRLLNE